MQKEDGQIAHGPILQDREILRHAHESAIRHAQARPACRPHWGEIAAADFFATEVWTWHGLVTFYTVFVIDLASRRVQILGSTPHPDETFMCQIVRNLTLGDADQCRVLVCDRDAKWSRAVRARLQDAGIRVVQTPYRAPNAKDYASYCTAFV
jgi:hypothetical protein